MSSSPPSSIHIVAISPEALAAAAERRTSQLPSHPTTAQIAAEHEKRQKFRRLIDPGILRPNSKEQAMSSLQTLLTISENLLREPDNPKYQQFKPTNSAIKRNLMDPKGALEFAIELGFRPEVINFQPFYTFNPRYMSDLRVGAAIIRDIVDLESEKTRRATDAKKNEKAAKEAAAMKVKLAYMDDRKTQLMREERERAQRAARLISFTEPPPEPVPQSPSPTHNMPGSGYVLGPPDGPPSYEHVVDNH